MRRHRDRKRAVAAGATAADLRWRALADTDPALAVAEWSEATLTVPAGHPLAGGPMRLPAYVMAGTFRADEDSMTAEGWLTQRTGGLRTSRRIAAAASNVQQAIVRLSNPAGDRVAVSPVWNGVELIRDHITSASKGEIVVTGLLLMGDVVVLRAGCFAQDSYRLA